MPLKSLKNRLNQHFDLSPRYGSVKKIMPNIVYADGFNPSVGDVVKIEKKRWQRMRGNGGGGRKRAVWFYAL